MEIQRLILIDFTALNGGIKKGSIDAILLSIEMIEKGFRSNRISKRETHTGLLPLNQILILKFEFFKILMFLRAQMLFQKFYALLEFPGLVWFEITQPLDMSRWWSGSLINSQKTLENVFCYFLQAMFPSERHLRKILCDVSSFVCA